MLEFWPFTFYFPVLLYRIRLLCEVVLTSAHCLNDFFSPLRLNVITNLAWTQRFYRNVRERKQSRLHLLDVICYRFHFVGETEGWWDGMAEGYRPWFHLCPNRNFISASESFHCGFAQRTDSDNDAFVMTFQLSLVPYLSKTATKRKIFYFYLVFGCIILGQKV